MTDLTEDRLGIRATPETPAKWPALDVFGSRYDKLNVNVVHVKGTQHFVAVPIGREWVPAEQTSERLNDSERGNDSAKRSAIEAAAKGTLVRKTGGDASITD